MLASFLFSPHHGSYFFNISPPYLSFPALFPLASTHFCYIIGTHTEQHGDIVSQTYTLLFIISVISIVGVGCLRGQHPAVNNKIKVPFLVL